MSKDTVHVVVGTESDKLIDGHGGKMTEEQATSRAEAYNKEAERLGTESRAKHRTMPASELKRLTR